MTRRRTFVALSISLLLLLSGLVLASNMALMYRANLSVASQDYWISLPYRTDLATAGDVCDAIGPEASRVSYYDTETQAWVDWLCPTGTNFSLEPGRGIVVEVSAPTTAVFVGSHDPDLEVPVGGFQHAGRDYYLSVPYHAAAETADDLCSEIPHVSLIARFDSSSGLTESWTCPLGTNFALQVGEALRVQVAAPSSGFIPIHY